MAECEVKVFVNVFKMGDVIICFYMRLSVPGRETTDVVHEKRDSCRSTFLWDEIQNRRRV